MAVWVFRSGRRPHQYPAHSPIFSQAPPEPRPAAWVYAARSQTHSVGPTPQDGPRLCRELDSARFGSTFFVIAGNSTSSSRGSAATCGLGEESPPWSLPQDGSKPAVRSWRREGSNGQRQTPDSPHPCPSTAHGSPGDVGEVAPLTENDAGSQVQNPEGTACPVVVGPVSPASRLSSPDAFCCNQVGWRCPSRCRS